MARQIIIEIPDGFPDGTSIQTGVSAACQEIADKINRKLTQPDMPPIKVRLSTVATLD